MHPKSTALHRMSVGTKGGKKSKWMNLVPTILQTRIHKSICMELHERTNVIMSPAPKRGCGLKYLCENVLQQVNCFGQHNATITFTLAQRTPPGFDSKVYLLYLPSGSSGLRTFSHSSCRFFLLSSNSDSETNFRLRSTPSAMAVL